MLPFKLHDAPRQTPGAVGVLATWTLGFAALLAANACNTLSGIDDFSVRTDAETGIDGSDQGDVGGSSGSVGDSAAQGDDGTATRDATGGDGATRDGARDTGTLGDAKSDASDSGGAEAGSCDGGLVTHANGLGQMFSDCTPLNTFNQTQAFEACAAFSGDAGACKVDPGISCMGNVVCSTGAVCGCWVYDGSHPGRYCSAGTAACCCPGASGPMWN
jgi:hypothetical protein